MERRDNLNKRLRAVASGLMVGLALAACSDTLTERVDVAGGGRGVGVLNLSIDNRGGSLTRAVGDPLPGLANPEEKVVKNVAFFVRTQATGEGKPGVFASFFSDASGDEQKLSSPLKEEGDGLYSCQVTVQSPGWNQPEVVVIANYDKELGDRLKALTRWSDLPSQLCGGLTGEGVPATPLLMYGKIDDLKAWTNNEGGVVAASIGLQRMVARIDIENHAYKVKAEVDGGGPDVSGYIIDSVRLVRTHTACYLLPPTAEALDGLEVGPGFPAVKDAKIRVEEKTAADGVGKFTIQRVDTLYAFENLNEKPASATAVMIFGRLNDNPLTKVVEFLSTDKTPIALARNHRYLIKVEQGAEKDNLLFNVAVSDWNEAEKDLEVSPTFMKPRLENIQIGGVPSDKKEFSFTGDEADGEKVITFDALCPQNPTVGRLGYAYDTDGSSVTSAPDWLTAGEPSVVKDSDGKAWIKRSFTVKVSQNSEKVPVHIQIPVYNGVAGKELADTITIRIVPNYEGIAVPVLLNGHYWAPVNVGATRVATSLWGKDVVNGDAGKKAENTAQCGKLYQWGRNQPFDFYEADVYTNEKPNPNTVNGPLSLEEASKTTKFISMASGVYWMNPADYTLWNKGSEDTPIKREGYDPCPAGWRIATAKEWQSIIETTTVSDANKDKYEYSDGVLTVKGTDGAQLTLPLASYILNTNLTSDKKIGERGYYWTSGATKWGITAMMFQPNDVQPSNLEMKNNASAASAALAYPVRCVQE